MKYDIAVLKRKMLVKYPFFGSVVASIEYKENKEISTAGTDGKTIYYNPEYLESLSAEEQIFIFAHEVCHIAFNHILRSEGKNHEIWNVATDAVINQFLKRDGLKLVEGGVDMADATNYDAEQLYEKLLQEKQQNQQHNQGGSGQGVKEKDSSKKEAGHDIHSLWKNAVEKHKEEQQNEKTESLFGKLFNKQKEDKNKEKIELEKKQEELEKIGEKEAFKENREERKQHLEELKKAIVKQASTLGTTNGYLRQVENIGTAKPLIDWRYLLKEAIKYEVDWSYKNATFEDGVLTSNLEEQPIQETEILLDTSGSIDEILLKNFLRECKNILQQSKVKVGCFDTEFYGFHEVRTEKDIEKIKFEGGGGTDFDVAVNSFTRRVENKIIFTDGGASMPEKSTDAIWIVFGGRKINPLGGKVINITEEQLYKLHSYEIIGESKGKSR